VRRLPDDVIYAICPHVTFTSRPYRRTSPLDQALYACDEAGRFISHVRMVRPDASPTWRPSSVKKKLKAKGFARNVTRRHHAPAPPTSASDLTEQSHRHER